MEFERVHLFRSSVSQLDLLFQFVQNGHIGCSSSIYLETYPLGTLTQNPINATNYPQWLNPAQASSTICYTNAYAPQH